METKIKRKLPKGRPVLAIKKSFRRTVRYNENQYKAMLDNAKQAGMNPAEWIRESSVNKTIKPRFDQEDRKVLHVLAGASNNLNQLTALSHQMGLQTVQKECLQVIDQISGYLKFLNDDR